MGQLEEIFRVIDNYAKQVDEVLPTAMQEAGEVILSKSNTLAPKDTGRMVEQSDVRQTSPKEVNVRYNTDYAIYVHEDLEANHANGEAKFLEKATIATRNEVSKIVGRQVRSVR